MHLVGVDPGLNGAIVIFQTTNGTIAIIDCKEHHMTVVKAGGKRHTHIDATSIHEHLRAVIDPTDDFYVTIEDVRAIQGSSATSTFSFGRNLGTIEGVLASTLPRGYELDYVLPSKWKRVYDLIGTDKEASLQTASLLCPHAEFRRHDIAEAFLLAILPLHTGTLMFEAGGNALGLVVESTDN